MIFKLTDLNTYSGFVTVLRSSHFYFPNRKIEKFPSVVPSRPCTKLTILEIKAQIQNDKVYTCRTNIATIIVSIDIEKL